MGNNLNGSWGYYSKWKKPDSKFMFCRISFRHLWNDSNCRGRKQINVWWVIRMVERKRVGMTVKGTAGGRSLLWWNISVARLQRCLNFFSYVIKWQNCQHINCTNAKFLVWYFSVIRCQHWRILVKGYIGPFLLSFPTSFESMVILKYKRRKRNELLIHVILSVNIITVSWQKRVYTT